MFDELSWQVILILLIILLSIIEPVMTLLWVPFYMRAGIPISVTRFPVFDRREFENVRVKLIENGLEGKWYSSLVFKQISDTEVAFRNKLFEFKAGFRFRSQIRGIIILDPSYQIVIKGFWPLVVPLVFVASLILFVPTFGSKIEEISDFALVSSMIGVFTVIILVQFAVYRHVSQRIKAYFE